MKQLLYYVPYSFILLAITGIWKISSVTCRFSSIKIDYSDYLKSLNNRINEVYVVVFSIKYRYSYSDILLKKKLNLIYNHLNCCNHSCYCVNMVSVTSASRFITPSSRYHPCYQSRSSMYIRGLIQQNFAELVEAVPIDYSGSVSPKY